jgi:hypothetical protein
MPRALNQKTEEDFRREVIQVQGVASTTEEQDCDDLAPVMRVKVGPRSLIARLLAQASYNLLFFIHRSFALLPQTAHDREDELLRRQNALCAVLEHILEDHLRQGLGVRGTSSLTEKVLQISMNDRHAFLSQLLPLCHFVLRATTERRKRNVTKDERTPEGVTVSPQHECAGMTQIGIVWLLQGRRTATESV